MTIHNDLTCPSCAARSRRGARIASRGGALRTVARREPRLFDQVTFGLIEAGRLLSGAGIAAAWAASERLPAEQHDGDRDS